MVRVEKTLSRIHRGGIIAAFTLELAACGSRVRGTDSSTHWLSRCDEDSDCGDGFSCECGSCTKPCDSALSCEDLAGATCAEAQCGTGAVVACAKSCRRDAECGAGECTDGVCTFALQCPESGCASMEDASIDASGGTSGSDVTSASGDATSGDATSGDATSAPPAGSDATTPATPCPAMDVAAGPKRCAGVETTFWNGNACVTEGWCGCEGQDCADLFTYGEDCRTHYAACIDEVPACEGDLALVDEEERGWLTPSQRAFAFSVEVDEPERPAEGPDAGPPAEFTLAEWLGTTTDDAGAPTRTLRFSVDGALLVFSLDFANLDWPLPTKIANLESGALVELSVVMVEGEPVELRVRDTNGTPLLWFVQRDTFETMTEWSFGELRARVGSPSCKRVEDVLCNWLFTINELVVSYGDDEVVVEPWQSRYVGAADSEQVPSYAILNSYNYLGGGSAFAGDTCAVSPQQRTGFVLWRDDERDDQ